MVKVISNFAILILLITQPSILWAGDQDSETAQKVISAINQGKAREVARYFGSTVDLNLPGNEGTFSKNQAQHILRNFFSTNKPAEFKVNHQAPSREGSVYVIGSYQSLNGKSFRIYFLVKSVSGNEVLHLIQIEEK